MNDEPKTTILHKIYSLVTFTSSTALRCEQGAIFKGMIGAFLDDKIEIFFTFDEHFKQLQRKKKLAGRQVIKYILGAPLKAPKYM